MRRAENILIVRQSVTPHSDVKMCVDSTNGGIFVKDESGVCVCIRLQPGERLGVAHLTRMQEHKTLRIWMQSIAQTHNKKDNEHFWTLDAAKDSVLLINTESRSGALTRICERELKRVDGSSII